MSFYTALIVSGVTLALALTSATGYVFYRLNKLPSNTPARFRKKKTSSQKKLICVGDSITHGTMSANYVSLLEKHPALKNYTIINAGINGHLVINVLRRLNEIIECDPDIIFLCIGTNDAIATYGESQTQHYLNDKNLKLSTTPTEELFRDNYETLIERLKANTSAEIIISSLFVLGETIDHSATSHLEKFSNKIKNLSTKHGLKYIDFHRMFTDILIDSQSRQKPLFQNNHGDNDRRIKLAVLRHFLLKTSWDHISKSKGLDLTTDLIHLNDRSARLIADEIVKNID